MTKIIGIYGECEEAEDPTTHERAIKDSMLWLCNNGYRAVAIEMIEELAIALRLNVMLETPKVSRQAKIADDWNTVETKIAELAELIRTLPLKWRDPIKDRLSNAAMENHDGEC